VAPARPHGHDAGCDPESGDGFQPDLSRRPVGGRRDRDQPNPGAVKVGSLSLDSTQGNAGFAVDGAHAACGVAALSFTTQTNGGAGWTIPASGSSVLSLANALSMSTNAANACQGANFTVYLKVGP